MQVKSMCSSQCPSHSCLCKQSETELSGHLCSCHFFDRTMSSSAEPVWSSCGSTCAPQPPVLVQNRDVKSSPSVCQATDPSRGLDSSKGHQRIALRDQESNGNTRNPKPGLRQQGVVADWRNKICRTRLRHSSPKASERLYSQKKKHAACTPGPTVYSHAVTPPLTVQFSWTDEHPSPMITAVFPGRDMFAGFHMWFSQCAVDHGHFIHIC